MNDQRHGDTRERILDAAEALFMTHGFDGTSMRQLTAAAGVNLAAVNYHFGTKEQLVHEVFRRRLNWLNEERMRVLEAYERAAGDAPLPLAQIVDGFFGTLLRLARDPARGGLVFLKLLGRTQTEPSSAIRQFLAGEYVPVMERYKAALFRALPALPPDEVVWRFHFMLGASSYAIAATDAVGLVPGKADEQAIALHIDELQPRLLGFLLAGLQAPLVTA